MPHCSCGRPVPEASSQNRYCPYCGSAFVVPCENDRCTNRTEGIIIGRSTGCTQCGVLYRYRPDQGTPVLVKHNGPFSTGAGTVAVGPNSNGATGGGGIQHLVDMLPASGDPYAADALLANSIPKFSFRIGTASFSFQGSKICYPEARHGRVYVIPENGKVQALDYETLQPLRRWSGDAVPGWSARTVFEARIHVSETVVYLLYQGKIFGFDAGQGTRLFELSAADLVNPEAVLTRNHLAVSGTTQSQQQEVRIYDLADLCDTRVLQKKPLEVKPLSGGTASGTELPPCRLAAHSDYFYVLSSAGELLAIPTNGEGLEQVYQNFSKRSIHAWALGRDLGAVVLSPATPEGDYDLLTFDPRQPGPAGNPIPLQTVRPSRLRQVLAYGTDVLLLDEKGVLHQLPRDNPNRPMGSWGILAGLRPDEIYELLLIPWAHQVHVVAYCREQLIYRFRHVQLTRANEDYGHDLPGLSPQAADSVTAVFCGPNLYVCNLTHGYIHRVPLQ
jgi:hypothetical protein